MIDDDPSVREALSMLLKDEFDTHSASNVKDGVRLYNSIHPNAVILDLHLPDQHGLEALRSIRGIDQSAQVIILTGYATLEVVEESMRLGASDCLHKPLDATALRNRLKELIANDAAVKSQSIQGTRSPDETQHRLASSAFLHDVSNPLMSLRVLSSLLSSKEKDTAKLSSMIEQNVAYLASLVEQWRAFSEPETLADDFASMAEIVDEAAFFVKLRAEAKKVRLDVSAEESEACPNLNRHAVARILVNIVQNAIEASASEIGLVKFRAQSRNGCVEFVVSDNGTGVGSEDAKKIFEPHFTTKKKGTGLGLYIASKIVNAAKGSIEVCSRPERGTTFTVRFPIRE